MEPTRPPGTSSGGWQPAPQKRSLVWEHFLVHPEKTGSKCKHCGQIFKDPATRTLGYHLRNRHKIKTSSQPEGANAAPAESSSGGQSQITDHFRGPQQLSLEHMLSNLAAVDGLTFHTLANSTTLHNLWKKQGYRVPSCHKTIKRIVMQYSEKKKTELIQEIACWKEQGCRFSLTMDEWTSGRNRRYAGLNLHGQGGIILLGLVRISGSMPAERGMELIKKKLLEFGLDLEKDIIGISTDGATVMRKMGRLLPVAHQVCALHGLHLAITDVFYKKKEATEEDSDDDNEEEEDDDQVGTRVLTSSGDGEETEMTEFRTGVELNKRFAPLINKVRKISRSFRRSPLKNDLLERKCQEKETRHKQLLIDTKTRWNSMLAMVKRFLEMKDLVREVLEEMDNSRDFPSEEELDLLLQVVEVLEIVEDGSMELSKDNCDLEKADITFKFLLEELHPLSSFVGKATFRAVEKRVKERRMEKLAALLCFLKDPGGYNSMSDASRFLAYPRPTELAKEARDLYSRLFLSNQHEESEEEEEEPARKSRKERLADMIQGKNKSKPKSLTPSSTPDQVLESIKTEMHAFVSTDKRPPCLQKVYDALMTMPPTSVAVERSFSTSNMFVSKLRCQLNDDTINNLMFLRSVLKKEK